MTTNVFIITHNWKEYIWDSVLGHKCAFYKISSGRHLYTSLQGSWQVDLVIFHKCRTKVVLSSRTDFTFLYISIHFNIYILGVTCADPGQIENGGRTGGSLACDASITYTCNECYTLTGTATLTCGINGQWNAQTPTCTRTYLSVLPSFKNIDIIMPNKLIFKGQVTNVDVSSYVTLNLKLVILTSGVSCLDPGQIANGVRIGSAPFFCGSVVTYTCSAGFRLEGSATRVCGGSGQWSTAAPVCRQGKINVTWMDGLGYVFDQWQWKKLFIEVDN